MLYYFVPVLCNPLELEAITFKAVIKARCFFPTISGSRRSYLKNLSSTATGWLMWSFLLILKCIHTKNAVSVSRPPVHLMLLLWKTVKMKQWENCLRNFAVWGNSSPYKIGQAMPLSFSCFLHQPRLLAETLPTRWGKAECKLHTEEGEWKGDIAKHISTETGKWICIPWTKIWIFSPKGFANLSVF